MRSRRVLSISRQSGPFSRVCSCFPEFWLFGPGAACFSLGRPGPSLFQDMSGVYLSPAMPVSLGGCPDLGQVRSVVRALSRGPVYPRSRPFYFRVGHAGLSRGVPCVRVASCLFPGSLVHLSSVRSCFPTCSLFGSDVIFFRLAVWGPVNSRTGPGFICCRPRRVFSLFARIWARPRLLFGRLLGGPVYFRAAPVYFRVGHPGLSCVFPGSLAHASSARSCVHRF